MVEQSYIALSRKYRPQRLQDVQGQETLVRILTNAITHNRLGHAFLFHGIRGTGKTTTARLLARCLNCVGADGQGGVTIEPCGVCDSCVRVGTDSHIDVIEMDAASHTGVDDMRELIESSRYKPVSARFKVFIIDEVHMLSKSAFNALLKTLEEPPPHVKFLLATTELQKVPETVLSRCMRFDLERIHVAVLTSLYQNVASLEGYTIDVDALQMIAHAADGSARDGMSILDQAINTSDGQHVSAEHVQKMLGLMSQKDAWHLLLSLIKGDMSVALDLLDTFYRTGGDPVRLVETLMDNTNVLLCLMMTKGQAWAQNTHIVGDMKAQINELYPQLRVDQLHRLWMLLVKGYEDVRTSPLPLATIRMLFMKLIYVSDLPTPHEVIQEVMAAPKAPSVAPAPNVVPLQPVPHNFEGEGLAFLRNVCAFVHSQREVLLATTLEHNVQFVEGRPGFLKIAFSGAVPDHFVKKLKSVLDKSGMNWSIEVVQESAHPTLTQVAAQEYENLKDMASTTPLVKEVLAAFPEAVISNVTKVS